ncbi:MAG: autotransporter outer membrane beta-barrel domain-containing protein [Alphaproteobacteria bacterium]|nr:autotransporter outer membrane beta-barrel domain-containing protein [Alphaproteobacteria bacterium]
MRRFLWTFLLSTTMISTANATCSAPGARGNIICTADGSGNINEVNDLDLNITSGSLIYAVTFSQPVTDINFVNNGDITNAYGGGFVYGTYGVASSANITFVQNADIYMSGNSNTYGLNINDTSGLADITWNGDIIIDDFGGSYSHGIVSIASETKLNVGDDVKITMKTNNDTNRDMKGIAIISDKAEVNIGKNVIIDVFNHGDVAVSYTANEGSLFIDKGSQILGRWAGITIGVSDSVNMVNYGLIDSNNSHALYVGQDSAGSLSFANYGTVNGYIHSRGTNLTLNHYGTWNLIDFSGYNNALGIRDTLSPSVQGFAGGSMENNGVITMVNTDFYNLSATTISTSKEYKINGSTYTANQYLVDGNSVHDMNNGAMQAAFYNLSSFSNKGEIDMTYNSYAGDVLRMSSGLPTGSGGGASEYISNGGLLKIDTVLNEGGANSVSDVLVVDNTVLGSGGATSILVKNAGGMGAETTGEGIKVVEVLGTSSDAGSFKLGSVLTAGIYEYALYQGDLSGIDSLSWYLRANSASISPKIGGVLATQSAMNDIFMHGLYDRLGRPSFIDNCSEVYNKYGMWARIEGRNASGSVDSSAKFDSDIYSTQIGSDIYRTDLEKGSVHVGLMGGYGRINTESKSKTTGNKSEGTANVYGLGTYATYYNGPLYIDGWTQYSWASNKVGNKGNAKDKYDSSNITLSIETGYGLLFAQDNYYHYIIEPQAQLAYVMTEMDSYTSKVDGLHVSGKNDGFISRLGTRIYTKDKKLRSYTLEPYVEANWIHNTNQIEQKFDGNKFKIATPKNKYEFKAGLQSAISQKFQIWGDVGYAFGKHSFDEKSFTLGARYLW